jgi:hypothetical protein
MTIPRGLLAPVLLLAWAGFAHAASFADLAAWKEIGLLNDRIRVSMPEVAQLAPPSHHVMQAPQPAEKQLRVMVDAGEMRIVAFVDELFRVAGKNFAVLGKAYMGAVQKGYGFEELALTPVRTTADGLDVLEFAPKGKASFPNAHLIRGVLLRNRDGAVQQIGFFLNDAGLADRPAADKLVARAIASLKPGARSLVSGQRARLADTPLTLTLPATYTAYAQRGPDFRVYWVEHLVSLEERAGRLGIYSGSNPQRGQAPATARSVPTTLFGVAAEWKMWQDAGEKVLLRQEAFLGSGAGRMHVFLHAVSEEERAALQRIAESATLQ